MNDLSPRQRDILHLLRRDGEAGVEALATLFVTTPQTIRKDLKALGALGHVVRYHGGARLRPGRDYLDYDIRGRVASREKRQIGLAAADRLPQGATVFINAGTTTEAAAQALPPGLRLTVITDNVHTANILRQRPEISTIICGGTVRVSDGAVVGSAAVSFLEQFQADYALISAAALGRDGVLMDYDLNEVAVARIMVSRAKEVIVLMDSHKFDALAPVRIGPVPKGATLITDRCGSNAIQSFCQRERIALVDLSRSSAPNAGASGA